MSKILVAYKSRYGTTKKYAEWIAEDLDADIFDADNVKPEMLMDYDIVVYGAGLYAEQINGVNLVTKTPCKKLIVFTVGLADPKTADFSKCLMKNFTPARLSEIKAFHLRGAIEYAKLSFTHSMMMKVFLKTVLKKDVSQMSDEEKAIAATNGRDVDFIDRGSIETLVEYVRAQ